MTGQGDKVLGRLGETAVRFINFVLSPSLLVPLSPCPNFTGKSLIRTVLAWELQLQARADLADRPWTWNDIATYPTLV